jgi:hypothetical protein
VKWCNWFCNRGHEVHVISFTQGEIQSVIVHHVDVSVDADSSDIKKLKYLISGRKIRHFVDLIKPDIVSVHYASSYGVAVALSGLKGYILSVWGSDIYAFPKKSFLHRLLCSLVYIRRTACFPPVKRCLMKRRNIQKRAS